MGILSQAEYDLLANVADSLELLSGKNGTKVYGGTSAYTDLDLRSISVREDSTAFTSLTCVGGGAALGAAEFILGGATLLKGDLLVAPHGYRFTAFQLSAGSVSAT